MYSVESPVIAFDANTAGKIVSWNLQCQEIFGYTEQDVLLQPVTNLLPEPLRDECQSRLVSAQREGAQLEAEMVHADGHRFPLRLVFLPQFRGSGTLFGYRIVCRDSPRTGLTRDALIHNEQRLRQLVDCLGCIFYVSDRNGRFLIWNKSLEQLSQKSYAEIKSATITDFIDARDLPRIEQTVGEVFADGEPKVSEFDLIAKDGARIPHMFTGTRIKLGEEYYLCGMGLDISERRKYEETLRLHERALNASLSGIVITECRGNDNPILYVNPAFERITGYSKDEVVGRDSRFMAAPGLDDSERHQIRRAINENKEIHVTLRNARKNGEVFWNDLNIAPVRQPTGEVSHFIGVLSDVTTSRQRAFHLEHEANHDALTGLANRNLFWDRLEQGLHLAERNKSLVAVVFIDLDNFKAINDNMGHDAGDELLRAVSKRLKACVRESDTVARMGGDEFVVILVNQPSLRFTLRMIERLKHCIRKPLLTAGREVSMAASIGISLYPHDGQTAGALLQAADVAMYHAKALGRDNCQFFSSEMKSSLEARRRLELALRSAMEKNEIFLAFQPKLCLRSGAVLGAESLLRWQHPEQGVLLPAVFLSSAEDSGLIVPLGRWVLRNTCMMLKRMQDLGHKNFVMSLNVSARELKQKDYVSVLAGILVATGAAPQRLELEITEGDLMRSPQHSRDVLAELRKLGVQLTIDHFGTAASNIGYLKKLAVNHLKLSRSTISNLDLGGPEAAIAKTVISLGHNLDISVTAGGVETSGEMEFLKMIGCDEIQGNYFSGPLQMPELERMLSSMTALRH